MEFDAKIFQNLFNLGDFWEIVEFGQFSVSAGISESLGFYFKLDITRHVLHNLKLNSFLIFCIFDSFAIYPG